MRLQLDLDLDSDLGIEPIGPGDTVGGSVLVLEGGPVRLLGAALEFHEDSRSGGDKVATSVWTALLRDGELTEGMRFPFTLTLPDDALPGYRSENGELYWEVHVRAGRLGSDAHARRRIVVGPAVKR